MSSRREIISRLRRGRPLVGTMPETVRSREIFADYPQAKDLFACFSERIKFLRGECYAARSKEEAAEKALSLLAPEARVVYAETDYLRELVEAHAGLAERLAQSAPAQQSGLSNAEVGGVQVGMTGADFLVARTGSVVLRSSTQGGRRLSVAPETHIVFAHESQIVFSIEDCLPDLKVDPYWSMATLISGPSRTSDIEKTLVLGAHGPKRLAVIVERPEYA